MSVNVTEEVLRQAGKKYYIRVSAANEALEGASSLTVQYFLFVPRLLSPSVSQRQPLGVASGEHYVHIWTAGSSVNVQGVLQVTTDGLPFENLSVDIMSIMFFDGLTEIIELQTMHNHETTESLQFFSLGLPSWGNLPCSRSQCAGRIVISSRQAPHRRLILPFQYFKYPNPEVASVLPSGGPLSGGVTVNVRILDFVGSRSRYEAGLPSFEDTLREDYLAFVSLECGSGASSERVPVSSRLLQSTKADTIESYRTYELSFRAPESPCHADHAQLRFHLGCFSQNILNCEWLPALAGNDLFLYRAPGIVEILPPAGMINIGNEIIVLNVVLENVPENLLEDVEITLGDQACTVVSIPTKVEGQEQLLNMQVAAPQFPRESAGLLVLKIGNGTFGPLEHSWEFVSPPVPTISKHSLNVDHEYRSPLWIEVWSNTSRPASLALLISDLSARYDIDFDRLKVILGKSEALTSNEAYLLVGDDVNLSCEIDVQGLTAGHYNLSVHVFKSDVLQAVIPFPTSLEIRDLSQAGQVEGAIAPKEGPVDGGTLILLGIFGVDHISRENLSFKILGAAGSASGEVVGSVPLALWGSDAVEFRELMLRTNDLGQGSKQLISEYASVVQTTRTFVAKTSAVTEALILVVRTPAMAGYGLVLGSLAGEDVAIEFDFHYVQTPTEPAEVVSAFTSLGSASGSTAGGYTMTLALSNFVIVHDISSISIRFGDRIQSAQMVALEQSNSRMTVVTLLVPAGNPGTTQVIVQHKLHLHNVAKFAFEYLDEFGVQLQTFAPIQMYGDDGNAITCTLLNVPRGIVSEEFTIQMFEMPSEQPVGPAFQPAVVETLDDSPDGRTRTRVEFLPRELLVDRQVAVKVLISVISQVVNFQVEYFPIPTGPIQIVFLQPSVGVCSGNRTPLSMVLKNVKMADYSTGLNIVVSGEEVNQKDIEISSTFVSTFLSFLLPVLPATLSGPTQVSIWSKGAESSSMANATFQCEHLGKSILEYAQPSYGNANQLVLVRFGVKNFDANSTKDVQVSFKR